jgi:hypothetical protein
MLNSWEKNDDDGDDDDYEEKKVDEIQWIIE